MLSERHIEGMAMAMHKHGLADPREMDKIRTVLHGYWYEFVAVTWSRGDINDLADSLDIELSDEEVTEVMQLMHDKHDSEVGISHDTISVYITGIAREREG